MQLSKEVFSYRLLVTLVIYAGIIVACFYISYEVRFDFSVLPEYQEDRLRILWVVLGVKLVCLVLFGQFGSMLTYFSIPDFFRLGWALLLSAVLMIFLRILGHGEYILPRGMLLIDLLLSGAAFCGFRMALRLYRERITLGRRFASTRVERIAIVGAGDAGASLASDLINTPGRGFKPVVFLDDDRSKYGKHVHGVPIAGPAEKLLELRQASGVNHVIIAMPSAPAKRIREIVFFLVQKGYKVETMPALEELASGRARISRIRPVELEDLLGREEISLDSAAIRKFIEGRVVMVTGAGGSIGGELCRQIAHYNPSRLLMLDQSEPSLFMIEQEMIEAGMGALVQPLVADILDQQRMPYLLKRFKPEVIFHAAAHKHVYLMERQPAEAIHNNSIGTRLLAQMAAEHGVAAFVMISTDKAINPTSVMGASKRLAEIYLQALQANNHTATKFITVRFGNVLGSSGSVIPIFKKQIAAGGPVTVTHVDVTRYFMTIPEAAGLVMKASVLGKGGEIFVLDMGQPVKIVDLARQMIELSGFTVGKDIEIKFIGLKPGEKLYEELQHLDEHHLQTEHPRIMRFVPNNDAREGSALAISEIEGALYRVSNNELKALLKKVISEYTPFFD
ncbi:MAG TPA: nucleoside-diphosphate sugar epimerase/dehydratase [Candidatus Angelobacter sp.]|nr:nucleoside-diphosphate sugar epimerase/dehydratase [Candidatus Angelobacter sp.]